MNRVLKLVGLTIIISSFLLLITPSRAYYFDINLKPTQIQVNEQSKPPLVLDTRGKPIETNASYVILPANTIDDLPPNARGIGLFSFNQTCPFHVGLWLTALPLKFIPRDDDLGGIYEIMSRVNFLFDYPGQDCPEDKRWQVTDLTSLSLVSNSRGYVKTGGVNNNYGFHIVGVPNQELVYKLKYCDAYSDRRSPTPVCNDVNVVTIEPNVMVLVVNDGVPLHVKFEKF